MQATPDRYLIDLLVSVRWRLVRQAVAAAATNLAAVGFALLLGAAVTAVVNAEGPLWWAAAGAAALGLVEALTAGWQRVEGTRAAAEVFVPVRRSLIQRAHEHGDAVTDHHPPADLLTRATLDSEAVDNLMLLVGEFAGALTVAVVVTVSAAIVHPLLPVATVLATVATVALVWLFSARLAAAALAYSIATAGVKAFLLALEAGRDTVAGLHLTDVLDARARAAVDDVSRVGARNHRVLAASQGISRLAGASGMAAVAAITATATAAGELDAGQAVTAIALGASLIPVLAQVSMGTAKLVTARTAAIRLHEVVGRPAPTTSPAPDADAAAPALELRGVTVRGADGRPVIDDVELTLARGGFAAVAGPGGSGKSTLLRVAAGLLPPAAGSVRVGGHVPAELEPHVRPTMIGFAEQRPFVYDDTLAENLRVADPHASEPSRLAALLHAAAAGALATRLDGGPLGMAGGNVSGGEKRRIVIARALARAPVLAVLDDPSGSLDVATEAQLLQCLLARPAGTALLIASNRPALLAAADVVVVLRDGEVAACGSPAVLSKTSELYRALVDPTAVEIEGLS